MENELTAAEKEQLALALHALAEAQHQYELAESKRQTAEKEIQRLAVVIIAERGLKPSKYRISADGSQIEANAADNS
jgi:hypothetical protein